MSNPIVLGLDLSLTSSGYFTSLNNTDSGVIKTTNKGVKRLIHIRDSILRVAESYDPQLVVIEDYSYASVGQAFSIGELGSLIKVGLYELGFKILLVPPKSLKKFVTGNGNAPKSVMMLKTAKKYGVEITDDNICDSFGLVQIGLAYLNGTDIQYEKDVMKKLYLYE